VWDVLRGEVHKELGGKEGHTGKVNDLVFTEGATFLFSCSDDLQVIKWNVENGEIVAYETTAPPAAHATLIVW
jgi:WD40 repeat protein